MYPHPFRYHRADSLAEAVTLLSQLGEDARPLAGGQSLIPMMKLRVAAPAHLVDLNFIPKLSYIDHANGEVRFGALTRHAEIELSRVASEIPIIGDCAAGIADVQVRNRGTIGGSVAEADPSGDWGAVLLALGGEVLCAGPGGERRIPISEFILDTYSTALTPAELVKEISVKVPRSMSGGAFLAFKRSAPVYASASVAVQLTLSDRNTCEGAAIVLGCVGMTSIKAGEAEKELKGKEISEKTIEKAAEAAMSVADPQSDMRGSADYKRVLVRSLVRRALATAIRRCRGEKVEAAHQYA